MKEKVGALLIAVVLCTNPVLAMPAPIPAFEMDIEISSDERYKEFIIPSELLFNYYNIDDFEMTITKDDVNLPYFIYGDDEYRDTSVINSIQYTVSEADDGVFIELYEDDFKVVDIEKVILDIEKPVNIARMEFGKIEFELDESDNKLLGSEDIQLIPTIKYDIGNCFIKIDTYDTFNLKDVLAEYKQVNVVFDSKNLGKGKYKINLNYANNGRTNNEEIISVKSYILENEQREVVNAANLREVTSSYSNQIFYADNEEYNEFMGRIKIGVTLILVIGAYCIAQFLKARRQVH